jgi:hypothetical protein
MSFLSNRWAKVGLGALVVVLLVGGFLLFKPKPTHEIAGRLAAPECGSGYAIDESQVELRNEKNEIIGSAQTSPNKIALFPDLGCIVTFKVPEVPETKFYSIKIGSHEGPNYSLAQLREQDWEMTLGLEDAVTSYPASSADEMCDVAGALNDALNDSDLINDDLDEWYLAVEAEARTLAEMGAGHALKGDEAVASEIAEITTPLFDPLRRWAASYFSGINKLNELVEPANDLIPNGELDCNSWLDVGYS